jgi:hypothetical protein
VRGYVFVTCEDCQGRGCEWCTYTGRHLEPAPFEEAEFFTKSGNYAASDSAADSEMTDRQGVEEPR